MNRLTGAPCALLLSFACASALSALQRPEPNPEDMGGGSCEANIYNCRETPNPLPRTATIWIEEMTWMDVRDALARGMTTAIIPTGGVEPNGPWLATGKHNYILRVNCEAIARRLGDALCAPILPFVPEGGIDPPTGHMRSPGTISLQRETFESTLEDIARSLKAHGFETILFIGDSGGNQSGQAAVAARLSREWGAEGVAIHIPEYYDYASVHRHMEEEGGLSSTENEGLHDDPVIALNMFIDDPESIRFTARSALGLAEINGASLDNRVRNLEWARMIVDFRAEQTARAIREAVRRGGPPPAPPPAPRPPAPASSGPRPQPNPRDMGGGSCDASRYNCADTPNPLPEVSTVWIEEMTWMDVRDAVARGKTTVIIPTGGVEPNGPWLVTGKHNYVLRANCEAIARELGDALCAPIVKWVPEGNVDPPSGHMRSPGTISLRQQTFQALLTDIARSLRSSTGVENVVFIGDSGGNQQGQSEVAEALNAAWGDEARALHLAEYYRAPNARDVLAERGWQADPEMSDGLHDNAAITLNMMLSDLSSVRWRERVRAGLATIDGFSIKDLEASLALGREISEARSQRTARLIRERRLDSSSGEGR